MKVDHLPKPLQTLIQNATIQTAKVHLSKVKNDFIPSKQSQVGGIGFLPLGETYPSDAKGEPLALLWQINFAEVATQIDTAQLAHALPKDGILQVYIYACHDCYGLDSFDGGCPNDNYQVRFWQNADGDFNHEQLNLAISRLKNQTIDSLPFDFAYQYPMRFHLQTQVCSLHSYDCERFANDIAELKDVSIWDFLENLGVDDPNDCVDIYYDLANNYGHHLLGYPDFTQDDPRVYDNNQWQDYISLLQLDSDDDNDMMWGDCGIANFFIHPDDLKNGDFSKLIYYWDCH